MKISAFVLVLLTVFAAYQRCTADDISATINEGLLPNRHPYIRIIFSRAIPQNLEDQVLKSDNYVITSDAPNPDGDTVPATQKRTITIENVEFQPLAPPATGVNRSIVRIRFSGIVYGSGNFTMKRMESSTTNTVATDAVLLLQDQWKIDQPYRISGSERPRGSLNFQGSTLVGDFSYAYTSDFRFRPGSDVMRQWFNIEGSIPLNRPRDVRRADGARTDASGEIADFVQASFTRRSYNGTNYRALGLVARASGRLRGPEIVAQYQPAALFFANGRGFFGAETELGYRDGDEEWRNLTTRAPDRGHLVARLGGVVEFAPRLGPVNLDPGRGLRFYVRGRGWLDYAKNNDGNGDARLRGFLDTELFYNFNDDFRLFVRHEQGYLPPDLSRRTSRTFFGVGTAF